jgi:pimeloyl-ACP methyl ester carboxylesterase
MQGNRDRAVPYAQAPRLLDLSPRATLLGVDGARHAPHLDHADVVRPIPAGWAAESASGL